MCLLRHKVDEDDDDDYDDDDDHNPVACTEELSVKQFNLHYRWMNYSEKLRKKCECQKYFCNDEPLRCKILKWQETTEY